MRHSHKTLLYPTLQHLLLLNAAAGATTASHLALNCVPCEQAQTVLLTAGLLYWWLSDTLQAACCVSCMSAVIGMLPPLSALQAQNKTDFKGTLEARGFKLAAALFDIANMTNALNKPAAVYTVLV
jgi:hypothetical protein